MRAWKVLFFAVLWISVAMSQEVLDGTTAPKCRSGERLDVQNGNYICVIGSMTTPKIVPSLGQTTKEVEALLGAPGGTDQFNGKQGWYYTNGLRLAFRDDKLVEVGTFKVHITKGDKPPGKFSRGVLVGLDIATQLTAQLAFMNVCPRVYRKPILFMNADDLQWLQACNENGSMVFGVYVLNR